MFVKTGIRRTRNFKSLAVTLAIAFSAMVIVVLIIASGLQMYFSFRAQQKALLVHQQLIAQEAANKVEGFIREKFSILETITSRSNLAVMPRKKQKSALERLLGIEPVLRQLVLLNDQNQELTKVSRMSSFVSYGFIKRIDGDLFSHVSQGKIYIGSVYIDEITSEPMVIMAVPVTDVFSDFKGTLIAEANLKFMWDLVGGMRIGDKGLAYVVDKQGDLIAFGDISRVLRGENLIYLNEVNEFVHRKVLTHKPSARVVKGIQGNYVVANHVALGTPDWAVVVELPVLEAYGTVIAILVVSGLIMLLSFVLAVVFGIFLSKRIAKPIIKLRDAAAEIGKGKLDTKIEVETRDEIEDLAKAFNQMTQNLRMTTTSIDNLNREIAERKRVELWLRRSEDRYRTLLKNIPQRIFYKDLNSVYVLCNESYANDLGIKPEEIKGKTDYDFHPKYLADKYRKDDKRLMESGIQEELEESYILEGKRFFVHTCKSPVRDEDGNVIGIFGIFWDVTARKQAEERQKQLLEQLEKANQELKDFAYIVSHDLKAPLRGITTLANWVSTDYADKLDEQGREQINLLTSRVARMHDLIDGILQYSRIGRVEEEKALVNLNELVPEVIDTLAPPENISITVENELPSIECGRTRITQVFQNLIGNAVKYMDKPSGLIKIASVEEDGFWKFSVADNGCGMEEKYFEKVFQIFQTLGRCDKFESTGIGLSLVKKIVEMYGGKVWVESELGEGSTFYFTLPKQEIEIKDKKLELSVGS